MSDGSYGLGEGARDVISGIFGVLNQRERTDQVNAAARRDSGLEDRLAEQQKTTKMLMIGAFGILFIGALVAINRM